MLVSPLPVVHLALFQHPLAVADDGMEDLLPAEHLCLEQLDTGDMCYIQGHNQSNPHRNMVVFIHLAKPSTLSHLKGL